MPAAYMLETSHAAISVAESEGSGPACLLIHGNSACKEVFAAQMGGEVGRRHRLIAIDLPGHGRSSDARNPQRSYTLPGYADMAVEVMDRLGVGRFAVLGWSLGGHLGLEMFSRHAGMTALMITGTPPVSATPDSFAAGFRPSEHMGLTGKGAFSEDEVQAYAKATCGESPPPEPYLFDAVRRTDPRAREIMIAAALGGRGADQAHIAATEPRPIAVVNGGAEPFVNNAYLRGLTWANLWSGQVHELDGLGHAPFRQAPDRFDPIFARFLAEAA